LDAITTQVAKGQRRLLIQAPPGSGKTLMCVKFAVWLANPGEEEGIANGRTAVLLLTYSTHLVNRMAEEVAVELASRTGDAVTRSPISVAGCPAEHGIAVLVTGFPDMQVHVMTIDGLVDAVRSEATSARPGAGLRYRHAVVDEGHVVFSYQSHTWIAGQHRCKNPGEVREVLDGVLINPLTATVVVFHDNDYQIAVAAQLPAGMVELKESLPMVRNPGLVRDMSVPFSAALFAGHGRAGYFPTGSTPLAVPPGSVQTATLTEEQKRLRAVCDRVMSSADSYPMPILRNKLMFTGEGRYGTALCFLPWLYLCFSLETNTFTRVSSDVPFISALYCRQRHSRTCFWHITYSHIHCITRNKCWQGGQDLHPQGTQARFL
jgi:hypothetical protein